jgi:hypothetical protein
VKLVLVHTCAGKAKACVHAVGGHAHVAYLAAAVIAEGNLALRLTSGMVLACVGLERMMKETS